MAKHPLIPFEFFSNRNIMMSAAVLFRCAAFCPEACVGLTAFASSSIAACSFLNGLSASISGTYMYSWMVVTQGWSVAVISAACARALTPLTFHLTFQERQASHVFFIRELPSADPRSTLR